MTIITIIKEIFDKTEQLKKDCGYQEDRDEKIVDEAFDAGRRYEREKIAKMLLSAEDPRVLGGLKSSEEAYGKHI